MMPSAAAISTAGYVTGWPHADCPPTTSVPQTWTLQPPACPPGVPLFGTPPPQTGNTQGQSGTLRMTNQGLGASFMAEESWRHFSPAQRRAADPSLAHAIFPEGLSLAPQPNWLSPPPCLQALRVPTLRTPAHQPEGWELPPAKVQSLAVQLSRESRGHPDLCASSIIPTSPLLEAGADHALCSPDAAPASLFHRTDLQLKQPGLPALPASINGAKTAPHTSLLRGLTRSGFQGWKVGAGRSRAWCLRPPLSIGNN